MDEIIEHIARAIFADDEAAAPMGWDWDKSPDQDAFLSNAGAVVEALGIDVRHWVQHDGTRKRYFAITWTGADQ